MEPILGQFPNWQSEIEQLYLESKDFQELCHDYNEVSSLLTTWTDSNQINHTTIEEYRLLLKELETEILEDLQTRYGMAKLLDEQSTSHPDRSIDSESDAEI